jgi:protein-S-isoprenylcysteine O-methyltransferase Ste14
LGVTITVLGAVQIISLVAKPERGTKARAYWTPWHTWIGRATALLAIANVYYGMIHVADVSSWAWILYTVILAIIIALGLANDIIKLSSRIPSTKAVRIQPNAEDEQPLKV